MERRKEARVSANQPVQITTLDGDPKILAGIVLDASGRGLRIAVPQRLAPGTLLRLDCVNCILLGEVTRSSADQGQPLIGVRIEHVLANLSELATLRDSLAEAAVTDRRAASVSPGVR